MPTDSCYGQWVRERKCGTGLSESTTRQLTKVALLDDDPAFLDLVDGLLPDADYQCTRFTSGRQLIRALHDERFDLFVLDWNLPELSGLAVLEWIRNRIGSAPPALLLTSRTADQDVVAGLNAGADDFISKPLQPEIFLARLRAMARRAQPGAPTGKVEQYGPYEFDSAVHKVRRDGVILDTTPREFQIALLLFRNLNIAVSRTYLFETIWGFIPVSETRTLDIHISKIRRKLALTSGNGYLIAPIYGHGYRLEEVPQ